MTSADVPEAPQGRLELLRELAEALRPQVLNIQSRSEHGLQGASGVISNYLRTLEQIEALEKAQPAEKGTVLDELNARRAQKSPRAGGSSKRQQRRG